MHQCGHGLNLSGDPAPIISSVACLPVTDSARIPRTDIGGVSFFAWADVALATWVTRENDLRGCKIVVVDDAAPALALMLLFSSAQPYAV
jgi:hypothetical protein